MYIKYYIYIYIYITQDSQESWVLPTQIFWNKLSLYINYKKQ